MIRNVDPEILVTHDSETPRTDMRHQHEAFVSAAAAAGLTAGAILRESVKLRFKLLHAAPLCTARFGASRHCHLFDVVKLFFPLLEVLGLILSCLFTDWHFRGPLIIH